MPSAATAMPTENHPMTCRAFESFFSHWTSSAGTIVSGSLNITARASCTTMIPQFLVAGPHCEPRGRLNCLAYRADSGEPFRLFLIGKKAGMNRVRRQQAQLFAREALLSVCEQVLVGQVGTEEGGVVGVECDQQPCIEVVPQRMRCKRRADTGPDIRSRVQLQPGSPHV